MRFAELVLIVPIYAEVIALETFACLVDLATRFINMWAFCKNFFALQLPEHAKKAVWLVLENCLFHFIQ